MTDSSSLTFKVDHELCVGHGRCYAVAPELFEPDEQGFSVVVGEADDEELREELDMAARNCPERAVLVSNTD